MERDLIFDVGMHRGEDTAFYLSRGYRVVGVEADPGHVEHLRRRFMDEMQSGRVVVVDKALAVDPGKVRFVRDEGALESGTTDPTFEARIVGAGMRVEVITVEAIRLDELMNAHGVPYYLKMDIEGLDLACLASIEGIRDRPAFVSVESVVSYPAPSLREPLREVQALRRLGYSRFCFSEQSGLAVLDGTELTTEGSAVRYKHEVGASGPFGREIDSRWHSHLGIVPRSFARLLYKRAFGTGLRTRWAQRQRRELGMPSVAVAAAGVAARRMMGGAGDGLLRHRWWDLHAALPGAL